MLALDCRIVPCFVAVLLMACPADPVPSDPTVGLPTTTTGTATTGGLDGTTAVDTGTTAPAGNESSSGDESTTSDGSSSTGGSTTDGTTGEISVCGNNVLEGNEVCDLNQLSGATCQSLGYQGGSLGCNLNCTDYNILGCFVCGNGVVDIPEDCEVVVPEGVTCESMGFEGGELLCGADCLWDTDDCSICGDGIRQGDESCDGLDFGGQDCAGLGLLGGTLACSPSCSFDPTGCDIPGTPFGSDAGYNGYEISLPMLPCDDISATGTPTGLTDDSFQQVPIGFTFPVYGTDYTDVTIESNGALQFSGSSYLTLGNSCLPTVTAPSMHMLYVMWDDLNPSSGAGEIYYETLGVPGDQRFVVQWDTAHFGGNSVDLMRFQVVLHEGSGIIDVCYPDTINAGNAGDAGAQATAGIQENSGSALQFSCNTPDLVDGLQLLYIPI